MRTRAQYRPPVNNGQVPKRRASAPRGSQKNSSARRNSSARTRRRHEPRPLGTQILVMLIGVGAVFAAIFVFALHWQSTAYRANQNEVTLRSALDTAADERRQLTLEQNRALSPLETEQRGKQAGLSPYKLDPRASYAAVAAPKAAPKSVAAKPAAKPSSAAAKAAAKTASVRSAPAQKHAGKAPPVLAQKRR